MVRQRWRTAVMRRRWTTMTRWWRRAAAALGEEYLGELVEKQSLPSAERGGALLLRRQGMLCLESDPDGVDGADGKLARGRLDQFHLNLGDMVDKDIAHLHDLNVDADEFEIVVVVVGGHGASLHGKAERLVSQRSVRPAFEARRGAHTSASHVREHGGPEDIANGIGVRIQFVPVQGETLGAVGRLDAEVQLQVARNLLLVLAANLKAPGASEVYRLRGGHLRKRDVGVDLGGHGKRGNGIVGDREVGW